MANAYKDENDVSTLIASSNVDGKTPVRLYADPVTHRLLVDLPSGSGTVTSVSVVSANGFAGTVATATTTPAITISTTINSPVLAGDGTSIAAAATTGSGTSVVLSNTPTLVTPVLGVATATSINKVTITAPAASAILTIANTKTLTVSNTLTLAGTDSTVMTFPTTSASIARTDTGQTFTGTNAFGVVTATTLNGNTFTTGTYTLTGAGGKTLTFNNSITVAGTDATTMTFPTTTATIARTDAAQTFTGTQTYSNAVINTNNAIAASSNAATVPITARLNTVTNSSAATLTITMTTASAVDGQMTIVRILDFSAVAQTITWVNTENSTVTAPTTSNGSTTLPLTVGFMYNNATSKWRCIASA